MTQQPPGASPPPLDYQPPDKPRQPLGCLVAALALTILVGICWSLSIFLFLKVGLNTHAILLAAVPLAIAALVKKFGYVPIAALMIISMSTLLLLIGLCTHAAYAN